jgi:hypothetical protein
VSSYQGGYKQLSEIMTDIEKKGIVRRIA